MASKPAAIKKQPTPLQKISGEHRGLPGRWPWIILLAIMAVLAAFRVHYLAVPLERDEGEYAYAGQLILQGIPPYSIMYNMKLPGIYAAYAGVMAVFGQTPTAIHLGLLLVNSATILVIFLIGRKLVSPLMGLAAAGVYGFFSFGIMIHGLFAQAEHFVLLPALGGLLLLLKWGEKGWRLEAGGWRRSQEHGGQITQLENCGLGIGDCGLEERKTREIAGRMPTQREGGTAKPREEILGRMPKPQIAGRMAAPRGGIAGKMPAPRPRPALLFLGALLLGVGFVIKQHGVLFILFGGAYAGWSFFRRKPWQWRAGLATAGWFILGAALPFGLTCLILYWCGVFPKFWFWCFSYASKYVAQLPLRYGWGNLKFMAGEIWDTTTLFCLLGLAGLAWVGFRKIKRATKIWLAGFALFSFLATCPGLYFRSHYMVLLAPAWALLAGLALEGIFSILRRGTGPGFGRFFCALLALLITGHYLYQQRPLVLATNMNDFSRGSFGFNPFPEAIELARYIEDHSGPDDRVAVIGSEPEIFFYSRRKSATGYIYFYPLFEAHPFARTMQEEAAREIEAARPKFLAVVNIPFSLLLKKGSDLWIYGWMNQFLRSNGYRGVGLITFTESGGTLHEIPEEKWGKEVNNRIMLFQRD